MERVVDRADLDSESSHDVDSSGEEILEKLGQINRFEYVEIKNDDVQKVDEDTLEFNLFAVPTSSVATHPVKVRLQSPEKDGTEPGFLQPKRNGSYYFTGPPTALQQQQWTVAAVSGQQVLARSDTAQPGCAFSWKVLHLPTTNAQVRLTAQSEALYAKLGGTNHSVELKRKRPGKKTRVKVRTRLAASLAKKNEAAKAAEVKAAAEREKRTQRNREKKVKKKLREKAKKITEIATEPVSVTSG